MRIVVGLTTVPSRVDRNLPETLESILSQTRQADAIYLAVPDYCIKEKRGYDLEPIQKYLISKESRLKILQGVPDDGPITKLLPLLDVEKDPKTFLVLIDDDTIYNRKMLDNLATFSSYRAIGHASRNPEVHGNHVTDLPVTFCAQSPTKSAFLETVGGVMYRRDCFPDSSDDFRSWARTLPPNSKFVDDIVIGAWLHRQNIPRYVVPCPNRMWIHDNSAPHPLAPANLGWRNRAVFNMLYSKGYYRDDMAILPDGITPSQDPWLLPTLIAMIVIATVFILSGSVVAIYIQK